jgi:hypothetical protein
MAVALPQPDQQDRLRVLQSAVSVASIVSPKYAKDLSREGVKIESELIAAGQTPVVSLLATGEADCKTTLAFVEGLYPKSVPAAEQSLIGAITKCPKQTLELVRLRNDAAVDQGLIAPRLVMALMEKVGPQSAWAQDRFSKLFSNLPSDTRAAKAEAPNYAAMFSVMADKMEKDVVRSSGLRFLEWLGKLEESGERNLAVNISTSAMKNALGEAKYLEALQSNVIARQVAESAGAPGEIEHQEEESASVLEAMGGSGIEQQSQLQDLPPSMRARQAAANGFARGTSGDKKSAESFFDMAFSAADEVWAKRTPQSKSNEVIEEVSEAAAHVDPIAALGRSQKLQDPTAQAISMLAVARVVLGRDSQ